MVKHYYIVLDKRIFSEIVKSYIVYPGEYQFKNKLSQLIWRLHKKLLGYIVIDKYKGKPLTENTILNIAKSYEYWDEI